jgi:hypothetical protein
MLWYQDGKLYEQIPTSATQSPTTQSTTQQSTLNKKVIEIADAEVMFWAVIAILLYAIKPEYLLAYVAISAVLLVLLS